jgi:hypothetical protein
MRHRRDALPFAVILERVDFMGERGRHGFTEAGCKRRSCSWLACIEACVNNSEAVVYDPTLIPKGDLAVRITVREGRCEGVG